MSAGLLAQYVMNGLMLGMMYALVAVGFTLFFGVLDVIKFSHGDVLMVGAFAGFSTYLGLVALGISSPLVQIVAVVLVAGLAVIVLISLVINRTKLGLAIRAVAQDAETAATMGINFTAIVLITFAIGSAAAAFAGVMNGLYYNEINFGMGLLLGVIGFSSAIVGGLGNIYGAILGGFLFAALQTIGAVALPFASAYKDVFAFAVVIAIMGWRPTGLIAEAESERA